MEEWRESSKHSTSAMDGNTQRHAAEERSLDTQWRKLGGLHNGGGTRRRLEKCIWFLQPVSNRYIVQNEISLLWLHDVNARVQAESEGFLR
jgi:hypothetical protein